MENKRRVSPKSKAYIKDTLDIIQNTEDDVVALAFLRDALEDDFPEMDLGSMDLHEAIKVLDPERDRKKTGSKSMIEDLNKSLTSFIDSQSAPKKTVKAKAKKRRRKKKK